MKSLLSLIAVFLLCGTSFLHGAENKLTSYTIAIPDKANAAEKYAADKLAFFLGKTVGKTFNVTKENQNNSKNTIYVGNTDFSRKNGITFRTCPRRMDYTHRRRLSHSYGRFQPRRDLCRLRLP